MNGNGNFDEYNKKGKECHLQDMIDCHLFSFQNVYGVKI